MDSTPNNFPDYTVPQRTKKVAELILILAHSVKDYLDSGENDAESRNIILAMCEVCISIPPEWFAHPEKLLLIGSIQSLYGDPFKFIKEIDDGTISYYNKFAADNNFPEERMTLDDMVATLHRLHEAEFGATI